MTSVLQMAKGLSSPLPLPVPVPGLSLRTYRGAADIDVWLDLRHRAFARQAVGVRQWNRQDFECEILAKSWWNPDRMWFAEVALTDAGVPQAAGTVTLALRGTEETAQPVVHWLAVLPAWRRRGVGRYLMAVLERCCWDAGYREVRLETHARWQAAVRFYQSLGYRPA